VKLIEKESGAGYWVSLTSESGQSHTINLNTTDRQEAERLVREAKVELLEDLGRKLRLTNEVVSLIVADRNTTCSQAVEELDKWMAQMARSDRTHVNTIQAIRRWMASSGTGSAPVGSITEEHINAYINDPSDPAKRGTRAFRLAAIRKLFGFCMRRRYILVDPSRLVAVNPRLLTHEQLETKHKATFTDAEVEYLLAKAEGIEPPSITAGFFRAAIILGRDLALRLGDICNLEWDSFNFMTRTVRVWTSKGGSRVEVPMTNRVLRLIASIQTGDHKYVFPNEREIVNDVNRRALLSVNFGRFLKSAGLDGYSFHSLRATYATTMANQGATLDEIAEALGHKGTEVTKAYVRKPGAAKVAMR